MAKIQLLIVQNKKTTDMTTLVKSVHWKGRKGSSARTLTVTMIDDDGYKHARSGIDVEDGNQCIFLVDGKERFRGILLNQNQGNKKNLKFTAYDNGIYLANNKDTFVYKNKTADQVFAESPSSRRAWIEISSMVTSCPPSKGRPPRGGRG